MKHNITLVVNGNLIDTKEDISIRISNILFDPTEIRSSQAEFSYSFDLPITPTNNVVFDYNNIIEKRNKFNKLYNTTVYADGKPLFDGQIKISEITQTEYKVNLVNVKTYDNPFGDDTLDMINWEIPFDGFETINELNLDSNSNIKFPLICFGAFQKKPIETYNDGQVNIYSGRYIIDDSTLFYYDSFLPSVNYLELIKRIYNQYGFDVQGNIFDDDIANKIYLTPNLASGQFVKYPYNLFGETKVNFNFVTSHKGGTRASVISSRPSRYNLTYKYGLVNGNQYNYEDVDIWDIFTVANENRAELHTDSSNYDLYQGWGNDLSFDNENTFRENAIVVKYDGLYQVEFEVECNVDNSEQRNIGVWTAGDSEEKKLITIYNNFDDIPLEIQLVKNNLNECELIYGGDPTISSLYPHEKPNAKTQFETEPIIETRSPQTSGEPGSRGWRGLLRGNENTTTIDGNEDETTNDLGYNVFSGATIAYDPYVNDGFICGLSTQSRGLSILKNGYSWNPRYPEKQYVRGEVSGYYRVTKNAKGIELYEVTDYNKNTYPKSTNYYSQVSNKQLKAKVSCCVWLNRNDILQLKAVRKSIYNELARIYVSPRLEVKGWVSVKAFSPNKGDLHEAIYNSPTRFPNRLNIGSALNNEVKISDFIDNFCDVFNLNQYFDGNRVIFEKNKLSFNVNEPIDLDDRINNKEISIKKYDAQKSLEVKFNVSTDEAGFRNSIPDKYIELDDFEKYGEYGSEKVEITNNDDDKEEELQLDFSYNWYHDFKVTQNENDETISIPVIAKEEYMIDNVNDEEAMKNDGYSLKQRMMFMSQRKNDMILNSTNHDSIYVCLPLPTKNEFELSYYNEPDTLLTRYYNIESYPQRDIIEFEVWLNIDEYVQIKQGRMVKVNSDLWYVSEITYDPSGKNKAQIKCIKRG